MYKIYCDNSSEVAGNGKHVFDFNLAGSKEKFKTFYSLFQSLERDSNKSRTRFKMSERERRHVYSCLMLHSDLLRKISSSACRSSTKKGEYPYNINMYSSRICLLRCLRKFSCPIVLVEIAKYNPFCALIHICGTIKAKYR